MDDEGSGAYHLQGKTKDAGLFSLEKTKTGSGNINNAYKYLKGVSQVVGARLFSAVPNNRTRSNEHNLEH